MLSKEEYVAKLVEGAERYSNQEGAEKMEAYMRNQFSYWGMTAPDRKEFIKTFIRTHKKPSVEQVDYIVRELWINEYREAQYIAMELLTRTAYWKEKESIELFVWLILSKSWWDTVDLLASNCVGQYFQYHPEEKLKYVKQWNASGNIWLIRTSLIFQLKYKSAINLALLSDCIIPHLHDQEFFIQKAIGWALRQTSRTHPDWVRKFVTQHPLGKLAHKEASKYL